MSRTSVGVDYSLQIPSAQQVLPFFYVVQWISLLPPPPLHLYPTIIPPSHTVAHTIQKLGLMELIMQNFVIIISLDPTLFPSSAKFVIEMYPACFQPNNEKQRQQLTYKVSVHVTTHGKSRKTLHKDLNANANTNATTCKFVRECRPPSRSFQH